MEVGSQTEVLDETFQPDLLEAYADTEITIFGMTGTFRDLASMCPVDLNDPRITLEAKNEFVVKAANEAGLAIVPEHEEVFNEVIERHGLERKFTVANPAENNESEHIHRDAAQTTRHTEVTGVAGKFADQQMPKVPATIVLPASAQTRYLADEQRRLTVDTITNTLDRPAEPFDSAIEQPKVDIAAIVSGGREFFEHAAATTAQEVAETPVINAQTAVPEILAGSTETPLMLQVSREAPSATATNAYANFGFFYTGEGANTVSIGDEITFPIGDELIPPGIQIEPLPAYTFDPPAIDFRETQDSPVHGWSVELSKPPKELLEDFTAALRAFAELPLEISADGGEAESFATSDELDDATMERQPVPTIVTAVGERIAELEPDQKELVASALYDVVGELQNIQLLETLQADPAVIAQAEIRLEEYCTALFELAGMEFDDQDVRQFVQTLLRVDFQLPQLDKQSTLDVERFGTHEVKRRFSQAANGLLMNAEDRLRQGLGLLALLWVRPANPAIGFVATQNNS